MADKIGVVAALIELAELVAVGGRMAFTLLAARGVSVGATQIEADWLEVRGWGWGGGEVKEGVGRPYQI